MAESRSTHRMRLEEIELQSSVRLQSRGQWFAFLLVLATLALAAYFATVNIVARSVALVIGLFEFGVTAVLKVRRLLNPPDPTLRHRQDAPAPPIPDARRDSSSA